MPWFDSQPNSRAEHAIEVGVSALYENTVTSKGDSSGTISDRNGGNAFALSIAYRSPYAVSAFVDFAWLPLWRSDRLVDLGTGAGPAFTTGSLAAFGIMAGPGIDVWRLRLRAGVGAYDLQVATTTLRATSHASEWDLGYVLSLAVFPVRTRRVSIGIEGRGFFVQDADVTALGVGFTIGGDAFTF